MPSSSSSSMSTFYEIKVGSNSTSGEAVKIKSVLVHPNYNASTIEYDIALIQVSRLSLTATF